MKQYYISEFNVDNLWGCKNYPIKLHKDVNVIIGPNASGKTTLINILFDVLTLNLARLARTEFDMVTIHLKSFVGSDTETITVKQSKTELTFRVGNKTTEISMEALEHFGTRMSGDMPIEFLRRRMGYDHGALRDCLRDLVPAVWLPVSRRLPIAEEEEVARRPLHKKPLESVDECLSSLLDELHRYRVSLNAELSELRKAFQRDALMNILYDKQHDKKILKQFNAATPLSDEDKQRFLQAFKDVGMVDQRMEQRINEHFKASVEAIEVMKKNPQQLHLEELMIIPLISRTREIVETAQKLEDRRAELFGPLHLYEATVNSFLNDKTIRVSDRGELEVVPAREQKRKVEWRHLSSGEKQILILLTQALLSAKTPHVYVADEPELSLHVTWQEKLLRALTTIAGNCQFIVATHSPDITADFGNKVVDLARL